MTDTAKRPQLLETPKVIINPFRFVSGLNLQAGLLHWWDLDDTGWADDAGSWNLTNQTAVGINSTGGPDGGPAASFNGSHYLDRTDVAWDGSGAARSVQIWGRNSSPIDFATMLITHSGSASSSRNFWLFLNPSVMQCRLGNDVTSTALSGSTHIIDTWFHLLLTTNGTDRHRIYSDGELQQTGTFALGGTTPNGNLPFAIGAAAWIKEATDTRHIGLACMAGIWDRELSEAEASWLYNSGAGRRFAAL